ncbi:hypothetical protein ACFLT2_12470 [Acidobacteriota bacterium]
MPIPHQSLNAHKCSTKLSWRASIQSLDKFVPGTGINEHGNSRLNIIRACDQLVPPGSAVANFFNTSGWMKMRII